MRAIVYTGSGGPDVVEVQDRPRPALRPGEVLVRVEAAGLNRADLIQRRGAYPAPAGWPPDVPGLEYAGTIVEVRPGVAPWRTGDRVMGLVGGGAQAELVSVAANELLAVPDGLDASDAAGIPEAFLTAWDALVTRARLRAGERVLVHAVGSGVGTAAVQLIKWLGATAIGTSRTQAKLAAAAELGLDVGIDTSKGGFAAQLDAPVDVVIDCLGGPALADNLGVLAPRGRLVLIGTLQGARAEQVDLGRVLRGRLELIGTVMRSRGAEERAALVAAFARDVLPAFAPVRGAPLRPVVGAVYPAASVREAHQALEDNAVFGKIVLDFRPPRTEDS